jgi:hypothetical protein
MADKKISALTASTTPLAGTEVLPIVQGGSTVKVSVANLTAGRTVSASALGVGTASPLTAINLEGGSFLLRGGVMDMGPTAGADGAGRISTVRGGDGVSGILAFSTQNPSAAIVEAMRIDGSGNVTTNIGNLVFGTAAKGIDFSANTGAAGMTSELLNWYEEGTWTPTQGAGLVVIGAFTSSGRYTRIGRQVTVSARLVGATSIACTAGGVFTTGLPYAPNNVAAGTATSSNLAGTVLYVDTTIYSVSAMAASGVLFMTATYSV